MSYVSRACARVLRRKKQKHKLDIQDAINNEVLPIYSPHLVAADHTRDHVKTFHSIEKKSFAYPTFNTQTQCI